MTSQKLRKPDSTDWVTKRIKKIPWHWVVWGLVVIIGAGIFIWQAQESSKFTFSSQEKQILVLLRTERQAVYQIQYTGRRPVELQSVKVILEGQILHVDVSQVAIQINGNDVVLEGKGNLPAGTHLTLNPGDKLVVKVTYLGQTLGGNYLYGFRIGYGSPEQSKTFDLEIDFDYSIIVE